jgi:hypothetical protein
MNDFDQAARRLARLDPLGLFRYLLPGLAADVNFAGWLDTRAVPFPGPTDRTGDTVAELRFRGDPGRPRAVVLEFQTRNDGDILERLFDYAARLRLDVRPVADPSRRYDVVAAVVNLTGPGQPGVLEMTLPGEASVGTVFRVRVVALREDDAARVLDGVAGGAIARCVLPWVPLMRGGGEPATMERWRELAVGEADINVVAVYAGLARIFAELTPQRATWREMLEGWKVMESATVNEWRVEVRREDIITILTTRFRGELPADLRAALAAMTDHRELNRLISIAVVTPSLDDFRAALQNRSPSSGEPPAAVNGTHP